MATTDLFSNMLNEYSPEKLISEEIIKNDWLLTNIEKDKSWGLGTLNVPFYGADASSISFGSLTASSDIASAATVRGTVAAYKEAWGSMIFNHKDLELHNSGKLEKSFLKILPNQIENFVQRMKETLSVQMLGGSVVATVTDATDAATGIFIVDRIERFQIGQKLVLDDGDSAQTDVYVIAVNVNTSAVTLSATRGGAAANLSAYSVAQAAKFYHDGVLVGGTVTNAFQSISGALLSAANGGSSTLYGQTKTAYPFLQAVNVSGSDITAANLNAKIFAAYNAIKQKGRGNANTVVMSFKHLGTLMSLIETQKGGFKVTATSTKASLYGWTEIEITSVSGNLKVVGVHEMKDSEIFFLDMSTLKFYSNGEIIKKRMSPDQKQYFEVRNTSGFQYVVDMACMGELVVHAPSKNGILHSISY